MGAYLRAKLQIGSTAPNIFSELPLVAELCQSSLFTDQFHSAIGCS